MKPSLTEPVAELHLAELSKFQQVLLITDGTLTNILEAYVGEKLQVVKLVEAVLPSSHDLLPLEIEQGREVMERRILLQGRESLRNWLYAESLIVPDRLELPFQERLLRSREPIGKLWLEYKVETFKEVITTYRQPAEQLAGYFDLAPLDLLLCRTYRVFSNRQPIMLITEKFPASFYG